RGVNEGSRSSPSSREASRVRGRNGSFGEGAGGVYSAGVYASPRKHISDLPTVDTTSVGASRVPPPPPTHPDRVGGTARKPPPPPLSGGSATSTSSFDAVYGASSAPNTASAATSIFATP